MREEKIKIIKGLLLWTLVDIQTYQYAYYFELAYFKEAKKS
ncbi:MAG: hypothetical protein AAF770_01185 [Bacteroidota bacterium]